MAAMSFQSRQYSPLASKPTISSPLASASNPRPMAQRPNVAFPTSRPLRPFPSITTSLSHRNSGPAKPVKIIEPPKNFRGEFVLNLTQAELSRQA